jgi:uncharacterized protein YutE (UPF0331/DUF86 family)
MVDPDRVRTVLGSLEEDLRDLAPRQDVALRTFRDDRDLQAIVERRFETSIQACLDIAGHLVASEGYREPTDYGDLFRILDAEGVLRADTADRMVEMAGFRNVLAHEYADIDVDRVHEHLQNLERFRTFAREIAGFLGDE